MKKAFMKPELTVVKLSTRDLIATSGGSGGTGATGQDIPGDMNEDD